MGYIPDIAMRNPRPMLAMTTSESRRSSTPSSRRSAWRDLTGDWQHWSGRERIAAAAIAAALALLAVAAI